MKLIFIIILVVTFSCSSSTTDNKDNAPVVSSPLGTITFPENSENKVYDLNTVFHDADGDSITVSVTANSNEALVNVTSINNVLTLTFAENKSGTAEVELTAVSTKFTITETFKIKVTDIDQAPVVVNPLSNITVGENDIITNINLTNTFSDPDNDAITLTVTHSNAGLLDAEITNNQLKLVLKENATGTSTINIKATSTTFSVTESFTVEAQGTLGTLTAQTAQNEFLAGNYSSALISFKELIALDDSRYTELAYIGTGFLQIKSSDDIDAYITLLEGLVKLDDSVQIKAGLAFLEYAYKSNFTKALEYAEAVLETQEYVNRLDIQINLDDIKLTIAQSHYSLGDYQKAIDMVKVLNPSYVLTLNDAQYKLKLLEELRRLAIELRLGQIVS